MERKRKPESVRYVVKWIEGNMMYFRAYKRDSGAVSFQQYLISQGIEPHNVRIIMK